MSAESKKHVSLWPVVAGVAGAAVVVLVFISAVLGVAAANAQDKRDESEARLKQAHATVLSVAAQRDGARDALSGCAEAYDTAVEVATELRSEMSDALDAISNYTTTGVPLDSDALVGRITATNEKQTAIDSTPCRVKP